MASQADFEPRWPVGVTILAVMFLLWGLPARVSLFPAWVAMSMATAVLVPMVGAGYGRGGSGWTTVERRTTVLFAAIVCLGSVANLARLITSITTRGPMLSGLQLLTSSIAIWATNVLAFSLLYWEIDRGGPELRARRQAARPDWVFPQESALEHVRPGWRPVFADYLFLGYCTATAFSPAGAQPLTSRAMMLMMIQSAISLVTIVVTAARSINVLGS